MLSIRVVRRRGAAVRSALATAEVTTTLVVAHRVAGGHLPSVPWVLAMAAAVFVAGVAVQADRVPMRVALPLLIAVQLALHAYLAVLEPMSHAGAASGTAGMAGMSGTDPTAGHHLLISFPMLLAHLVAAGVTALAWELRRRAVDVVVSLAAEPRLPAPPVRAHRRAPRRTTARGATTWIAAVAPRRGPPARLAPA